MTEVCLVHRVRLAARETPVSLVALVPWVHLVLLVCLVLKVPRDPRVLLVPLVRRETQVQLDLLDPLVPPAR